MKSLSSRLALATILMGLFAVPVDSAFAMSNSDTITTNVLVPSAATTTTKATVPVAQTPVPQPAQTSLFDAMPSAPVPQPAVPVANPSAFVLTPDQQAMFAAIQSRAIAEQAQDASTLNSQIIGVDAQIKSTTGAEARAALVQQRQSLVQQQQQQVSDMAKAQNRLNVINGRPMSISDMQRTFNQ